MWVSLKARREGRARSRLIRQINYLGIVIA